MPQLITLKREPEDFTSRSFKIFDNKNYSLYFKVLVCKLQ